MQTQTLDPDALRTFCAARWRDSIVPALEEFIRIPAKSPAFDADWSEHGHLRAAADLALDWVRGCAVEGLEAEIVELDGRTPTLLVEIPAFGDDASDAQVLMYGHLDKQPEVTGWDANKGPWEPVV